MNQDKISSELNKNICEAVGCNLEATTKVVVKVNEQRTISLQLCEMCTEKFQDQGEIK